MFENWTYIDLASFLAVIFSKKKENFISIKDLAKEKDNANILLNQFNASINWKRESYLFAINFYNQFFESDEKQEIIFCKNKKEMIKDFKYITSFIPKNIIKILMTLKI